MYNITYPLSIIGAQWGDEGKGKLIDVLAKQADIIVRYNGGNNAGHTVVVGKNVFKLSQLPSGIIHGKHCVIAQGCVIDPQVVLDEIVMVKKHHIPIHLSIDPRVHIVMPYHKGLDRATEGWKGKTATGSLHLGIGYCYEDKNNRFGIRLDDLLHPETLKEKIRQILPLQVKRIQCVFDQKESFDVDTICFTYIHFGKQLKQYMEDASILVENALKTKRVLFEGAHGTLLDPVFGTYPYTVAIHTISGSVFPYVGIAPRALQTLGIVKTYTTRVGNGPFPTEQNNSVGEKIRTNGHEFGTVSKRPRRCGWLDLPGLHTASRLSGFTSLALTKLDVLSGLSTLQICTSYISSHKYYKEIPASSFVYDKCMPVYKTFQGWNENISLCKTYASLPKNARIYVEFIKKMLNVPISFISVGPKRSQIISV